MIYIASVTDAGSSTRVSKSGHTATSEQRRVALQEAIETGAVREPGTYVVASPDTTYNTLNATVFTVEKITQPNLRIV